MPRAHCLLLALALLAPAQAPPSRDALAEGAALMKEGDFEAAVPRLEEAIRELEADPRRSPDLARAHLYLGICFLELDQEVSARAHFREAASRDREMRLDPREFSPQVIRFFEAAREEVGAAPPAPKPAPVQAPPSPTAKEPDEKKGGSGTALLVGGVVAVGAGAALALGSGGGGSTTTVVGSPTTTSATTTTTTTTPTATTTTTTTTMPPAACQYQLSPATQDFLVAGGPGICEVTTSGNCAWTAQSTESWITLTTGTSGQGNGRISFLVGANATLGAREGRVRLTQNTAVGCAIRQAGLTAIASDPAVTWTSRLEVPGGAGRVVMDGTTGLFQGPGASRGAGVGRRGESRIEALLVKSAGHPGTWSFELAGTFKRGSLRAVAGEVVALTADTVVFRLSGRPGDRIVFAFRTER